MTQFYNIYIYTLSLYITTYVYWVYIVHKTHPFEDTLQRRPIPNVDRIEDDVLAGDDLDASQGLRQGSARLTERIAQIIDDDGTVASVEQLQHGVRAHISGTARYQDGQGHRDMRGDGRRLFYLRELFGHARNGRSRGVGMRLRCGERCCVL